MLVDFKQRPNFGLNFAIFNDRKDALYFGLFFGPSVGISVGPSVSPSVGPLRKIQTIEDMD